MKFYTNTFYFIVVFCLFGGMAFGQANPFQKVDTTKARLKIKYKNQNSAVDLALDVNEQEFYLEFESEFFVFFEELIISCQLRLIELNSL